MLELLGQWISVARTSNEITLHAIDATLTHWFIYTQSDMCRAAVGGSLADFLKYARNPTFAQLVDHESWSGKLGNRIPATQTRGALTTTMVTVQTNRGQERKFLWTLQQQRRPPDQGCWLVHECLYVENAIEQTL